MLKRIFASIFVLCLISGCYSKGRVEFINVVQDHKTLTVETIAAVKASIWEDYIVVKDQLPTEDQRKMEDLFARLDMISKQSVVIEKYVMSKADEELIAEMLKTRWQEGRLNKGE